MFPAKCLWMVALSATVAVPVYSKQTKPEQTADAPAPPQSVARPLTAAETRDAQIAADTEKLYKLAQDLKAELDKSTKDTLSLTVVKKAAEIERLAHSISERMKGR